MLLAARRELAGEVEALWVVGRCLDHNETATFGRKLAREVLPAARARGLRPDVIDLTIRMIKSAVSAARRTRPSPNFSGSKRPLDQAGPSRGGPLMTRQI